MWRRAKHLVTEYLENISRKALEDYQQLVREYIKGKTGVYALYRGDRLKYVGLATDLRTRLRMHLTDRHAQSWDKFSVYLTGDDKHLRELEALVLRIAGPKENRIRTRFKKAKNLRPQLKKDIAWFQRQERDEILGIVEEYIPRKPRKKTRRKKQDYQEREASLKPYINIKHGYFKIFANWKGKTYTAVVVKSGHIKFNGITFSSPSRAAMEIVNHEIDGWHFWRYKDPKTGELVPLDNLRRK